jgi:hypothetical protein
VGARAYSSTQGPMLPTVEKAYAKNRGAGGASTAGCSNHSPSSSSSSFLPALRAPLASSSGYDADLCFRGPVDSVDLSLLGPTRFEAELRPSMRVPTAGVLRLLVGGEG